MKSKAAMISIASIIGSASTAFAASGAENDGTSLLLLVFLGFGAMVIAFQFIPGAIMLFSMIQGIFSRAVKDSPAPAEGKN